MTTGCHSGTSGALTGCRNRRTMVSLRPRCRRDRTDLPPIQICSCRDRSSAATLLVGLLASGANAQTVTMEQYQHPKSEKDFSFNKPYFEGIKDGLVAYNISREDRLFCLGGDPPVLTFERANDILMHWARKRGGDAAGLPLGLALLYSLKDAFPCKSAPR